MAAGKQSLFASANIFACGCCRRAMPEILLRDFFFAYLSSYNTSSFKMVFQAMFPAVNSSRIWRILKLFHVSLGNCNGSKLVGLKYFLLSFTSEVLTIFSPVFYSFARRCNNVYLAEETSLVNIKFVKIQIPAF